MSVAGVTGVLSWLRARPSDMATAPRPVAGAQAGGLGDARNGLFVYDRTALAQAIRFDDIPVLPACNSRPMIAEGGPVWPDWEGMGAMRHMRAGLPIDLKPALPETPLTDMNEEAVWGGHVVDHFGHFAAENSTRLLQAVAGHPSARVLFTLEPGLRPGTVPGFFWQVLDWYGVASERVHFVTQPLRVRHLWAAPMAEQLNGVVPSEAYLDLLARNRARNRLPARPGGVVYVARDRMEASGEGHNAGEPYLTGLLQGLGVHVIRPETMRLRDQLAWYDSARTLVFSEGSAMHGRQFLGRLDQDIVILNRRPRMRVALASLGARCNRLAYGEVTRGVASVLWPNGKPWMVRAISIYDTERLLAAFDAVGVALREVWNREDYLAARDAAIGRWIGIRFAPDQRIDHAASLKGVRADFERLGLRHLLDRLPKGSAP